MAIKYIYPGAGTVPATGAQASFANRQVATVDLLTTDTTTTFVHNWGFDTNALDLLCPHVIEALPQSPAEGTFSVTARNVNDIVFDCNIGTSGTFEIILDRPHSIIMPNQ